MNTVPLKITYRLTCCIAVFAAIASAAGLFMPELYRDNDLTTAALRGNDLVTLFIAVPLLLATAIRGKSGSDRIRLGWMGTLVYMLYNYIFYLYGASFNAMFLLYVALVVLSAYALIFGLAGFNAEKIAQQFSSKTPVRLIAGFMLFFGALLSLLWIGMSLSFIATGVVPLAITQTDHPTGVVFATDLTILIPAFFLGAVWLWKRQAWGYVLSAMMLVKACTYGIAMIAMSVFAAKSDTGSDPFLLLWVFLTLGCIISALFLFGAMKSERK
jgi:hypothetical protein